MENVYQINKIWEKKNYIMKYKKKKLYNDILKYEKNLSDIIYHIRDKNYIRKWYHLPYIMISFTIYNDIREENVKKWEKINHIHIINKIIYHI